jgi:hypothetical protein
MDNPRLELGTNGLRVRCSTIELVILVVGSILPEIAGEFGNKAPNLSKIEDNISYDGCWSYLWAYSFASGEKLSRSVLTPLQQTRAYFKFSMSKISSKVLTVSDISIDRLQQ